MVNSPASNPADQAITGAHTSDTTRGHIFDIAAGAGWARDGGSDPRESFPDGSAIAVDPLAERILERGRDVYTGDVGGLLEPLDQVRRD